MPVNIHSPLLLLNRELIPGVAFVPVGPGPARAHPPVCIFWRKLLLLLQ